ncbi:GNAT family N-acetyltransferase [Herpetosiphon llansteffanensis]|uniref:GNAT family N-acetyltransferase n=1 Tax=Herpetosiphon llansteffanensis TaxID=2094568 RepID=UPI000D7CA212|nr:GNAT family N-acetyltransferase [Herpetosiphon llansteffanensis]
MHWQRDDYTISTDPALLDYAAIVVGLHQTYWAAERDPALIIRSVEHSLCFGVYHGQQQIGLARVITDYAVFAYIDDVYILAEHRGKGLGKWLVQTVLAYPELQGLRRWLLATRNAQGLYAQVGFGPLASAEPWMEIFNQQS